LNDEFYAQNDIYLNELEKISHEGTQFMEMANRAKQQKSKQPVSKQVTSSIPKKENKDKKSEIVRFNPNIKNLKNPKLEKEDESHISYEKCKKKKGYLKLNASPQKLPNEMDLLPIRASLSLTNLDLYMSNESKSLFHTIKLNKILNVSDKNYSPQTFCFDIEQHDVENETLLKGKITLCANSISDSEKWQTSIMKFKECMNDDQSVGENEVIFDFQKLNTLLQGKTPSASEGPSEKLKKLAYSGADKAIIKTPQKTEETTVIKKMLNKVADKIKESTFKKNQLERKMQDQLKQVKTFSNEVAKKEKLIEDIVQKRKTLEREKEITAVNVERKNKELELIKATNHRILKIQSEEIQNLKQNCSKEVKRQKQKAIMKTKNMINMLKPKDAYKPPEVCVNQKLFKFEDKAYIKETCSRLFGENRENDCNNPANFCSMCCTHHIGKDFEQNKRLCEDACEKLKKGVVADQNTTETLKQPIVQPVKNLAVAAPSASQIQKLT
jgi:hypothetical protein